MRTRRILLTLLLIFVGLPASAPYSALAGVGNWVSGNAQYILVSAICRDGARFQAYIIPGNPGNSTDLGARLYLNPNVPLPDDTNAATHLVEDSYGPRLTQTQSYPLATHATPMPLTNPPQPHSNITVYEDNGIIRWSRELTPGVDQVAITHLGVGYAGDVVQDCRVSPTSVPQGGALTIGTSALAVNDGLTAASALRYTLTSLPAHGTLTLSGATLAVGAVFTQADIDANRLRYINDDTSNSVDGFNYSVRAITRVSTATNGAQANSAATNPALSANGAAVAFQSSASTLVSGDTNGVSDIFVRQVGAGTTSRVSVDGTTQANGASTAPTIDRTGNYVAFQSAASNLTSGTTACDGGTSDTNNVSDIFRATADASFIQRVSIGVNSFSTCNQGNGAATQAAISPGGFDVAFTTAATNLLQYSGGSGGTADTNGLNDIYSHNSSVTNLVSRATGFSGAATTGGPSSNPAFGSDGITDHIAFESGADNLSTLDNDTVTNIFVRDNTNSTVLVSRSTSGTAADASSNNPAISADGRFIAFDSAATNLVGRDTNGVRDIFVRDRDTDANGVLDEAAGVSTIRASVSSGGAQSDAASYTPALGLYGRVVAFSSDATNLVSGDTNGKRDIFVRDLSSNATLRASLAYDGAEANGDSRNPSITADGSYLAFESDASNLVPNDTNGTADIFLAYTGYSSHFTLTITQIHWRVFLPGLRH